MTYVVTESCIKCKYTDCVDVCPVDCFREGPNMLVIDPDECIDCTLCVPECPVEAIYAEDDVPDAQREWIARKGLCETPVRRHDGDTLGMSLGKMREEFALLNNRIFGADSHGA